MKKTLIILIFSLTAISSFACDICGCGGGNFYMGLLPRYKSKFIGLRYHYMDYNTQITGDATQYSRNYYNTVEMWGGINVGKHWQLLGFVPYHINKEVSDDGITNHNGIGDVTLLANYQLIHKITTGENKAGVDQQWWIGGGVKLPTGKFNADVKDPDITVADVNAQLGTGSVDFLLNTMYNVRLGKWGINTTVSYKINTPKNTYRFGDKFTANSIGYYTIRCKKTTLLPNVGVMYENTAANVLDKQKVASTGGYYATASAGLEASFSKLAIGINAQAPFSENYADGQTKLQWRGNVHVTFTL